MESVGDDDGDTRLPELPDRVPRGEGIQIIRIRLAWHACIT